MHSHLWVKCAYFALFALCTLAHECILGLLWVKYSDTLLGSKAKCLFKMHLRWSASKSALSLVGQVRTFALFSLYTLYRECILSLLWVECTDALLVSPYSSMESRVHSWVKCTFMCKYVYSHHIYI